MNQSNVRRSTNDYSLPVYTSNILLGTPHIQINNSSENVIHDVRQMLPLSNLNINESVYFPNFTQQYQLYSVHNNENLFENLVSNEILHDFSKEDITSNYNARLQLYSNKDIFYNIDNNNDSNDDNDIIEDNDINDSYKSLNDSIIEGKKVLLGTLNKYLEIDRKKNIFIENNNYLDGLSTEINQKLNLIKPTINQNNINNEESIIKEKFETIESSLSSIIETMKNSNNLLVDGLKRELLEKKKILKIMNNSFQIIKECNLRNYCTICLQNEVDMFYTSCGHTCCRQCIKKVGSFCHMCRKQISGIKSLFFNL